MYQDQFVLDFAYITHVSTVKLLVGIELKYMHKMFKILCAYIVAQIHK